MSELQVHEKKKQNMNKKGKVSVYSEASVSTASPSNDLPTLISELQELSIFRVLEKEFLYRPETYQATMFIMWLTYTVRTLFPKALSTDRARLVHRIIRDKEFRLRAVATFLRMTRHGNGRDSLT